VDKFSVLTVRECTLGGAKTWKNKRQWKQYMV